MATIRDKLWIWGHETGSHNGTYGLPGTSRMTPAEAAYYLNVPNMIMVRYEDRPAPPFDQYAISLRPLKQVVWSIVGAAGKTDAGERQHVIDLASRNANITGVMMDDFFSADGAKPSLTVDELKQVRKQLSVSGRSLDLWVVLYDYQLGFPVREHLALCDKLTFWTWKAHDLTDLERNFARAEQLAPHAGKVLGCYFWDYGQSKPLPLPVMQQQCEIGLRWLREGRIEGMIFLASCICDLELDTVEWTRRWITEVGDQRI